MITITGDEPRYNRTVDILNRFYPAHFLGTSRRRIERSSARYQEIWQQKVRSILTALEHNGDPRFAGASAALAGQADQPSTITVTFTQNDADILHDLGLLHHPENAIRAIKAIQKDQRLRAKSESDFISEMFGEEPAMLT